MTAANPLQGSPAPPPGAIFVDGIDRILAAGGVVAALAAQETSEGGSVEEDEVDEEWFHEGIVDSG
jgi:hypothetical protein